MAALGGTLVPGVGAAVPPLPPAPAPAEAKPPVVGTPTFCLLVKNMFDPATETDEAWELDIKEEMEEVGAVVGCVACLVCVCVCVLVECVGEGGAR